MEDLMKALRILLVLTLTYPAFSGGIKAQSLKKQLELADQAYNAGEFAKADSMYNATLEQGASPALADFNRGDALFRQERYEEAANAFEAAASHSQDANERAEAYYNLGNAKMKLQDLQGAVDAYKQALRNDPTDEDARHNLMLAKKQLEQQQQQQNQNQQQNQDQNQEQNQENQDQQQDQNSDQNQQDGQNQQEQNDEQNEGDQQQKGDEQQDGEEEQPQPQDGQEGGEQGEEKQQQARPFELSKEEAERMLEALNKQEKSIQQKLRRKKSDGKGKDIEKDW